MNKKDYVDVDTAKKLINKGFDVILRQKDAVYVLKPFDFSPYRIDAVYNAKEGDTILNFEFCEIISDIDDSYYINLPSLYEAQKWLRSKEFDVNASFNNLVYGKWYYTFCHFLEQPEDTKISGPKYDSYEEALLAGINEVLKLF